MWVAHLGFCSSKNQTLQIQGEARFWENSQTRRSAQAWFVPSSVSRLLEGRKPTTALRWHKNSAGPCTTAPVPSVWRLYCPSPTEQVLKFYTINKNLRYQSEIARGAKQGFSHKEGWREELFLMTEVHRFRTHLLPHLCLSKRLLLHQSVEHGGGHQVPSSLGILKLCSRKASFYICWAFSEWGATKLNTRRGKREKMRNKKDNQSRNQKKETWRDNHGEGHKTARGKS